MKYFLAVLLAVASDPVLAQSQLLLACAGDFAFTDTVSVMITTDSRERTLLTENLKTGAPLVRELEANEKDTCEFKISPIQQFDRIIKKTDTGWVISYSCGEDREISCLAAPDPCG